MDITGWNNLKFGATRQGAMAKTQNHFYVVIPQRHNVNLIVMVSKMEDILQNDWLIIFKSGKVMKDEERKVTCSSLRQTEEM